MNVTIKGKNYLFQHSKLEGAGYDSSTYSF